MDSLPLFLVDTQQSPQAVEICVFWRLCIFLHSPKGNLKTVGPLCAKRLSLKMPPPPVNPNKKILPNVRQIEQEYCLK